MQNTSQELIFMDLGCCGWVFEQVDEVLADGRSFICGDRFTAADLSFAALGSIMIAPQGYREHFLSALQSPYLLFCTMH